MEVVKLSNIVRKLAPELYPFLKPAELDYTIILKNGLESLDASGALEIVQQSICEQQKGSLLH
jgi:hypothetical protein